MGFSFGHLLVVFAIVLVVFGTGKMPKVMGDLGKGLRSFKSGMNGETLPEDKPAEKVAQIESHDA